MMTKVVYVILTYLVASIPFGLIFCKLFKGVDVRTVGSGNIGATNVFRAAGPLAAFLTALFDISKSFFPVLIAKKYFALDLASVVALSAVVGHCFSIYLKFKGGKGVATTLGAFFALTWKGGIIFFGTWLVVVLISGFVSLASIFASLTLPLYYIITKELVPSLSGLLIMLIIIVRHSSNIRRLVNKKEPKIFRKNM
ncbi:MAG: glycerol-3-phosphate 1-O-acyltransferase PlsY [Candidatus Hydrothermae bacterium]|nr:glycerol-3-phosphate 1-O-acyltransferase PlsY [Candidatus Hydrothermae bacterium]